MHLCPFDCYFLHHEGEIVIVFFPITSLLHVLLTAISYILSEIVIVFFFPLLCYSELPLSRNDFAGWSLQRLSSYCLFSHTLSRRSSYTAHDRQQGPLTHMLILPWLTRVIAAGLAGGDEGFHRRLGHDVQRNGSVQGGNGELLSF